MLKPWILAARPKTLPLALAGPITGVAMALLQHIHFDYFKITTAILCILVALSLQVLSNFANDLGDFQKGTDQAAKRKDRALTLGLISEKQMKWALAYNSLICLFLGVYLLISAGLNIQELTVLFTIGLFAIFSAIAYTVGKKAYGYSGFGDLFVFIFFGMVSVLGTFYVLAKQVNFTSILAAIGIGLLATMVLNINNTRDLDKDKLNKKQTIAVHFGFSNTRIYHISLGGIVIFIFGWIIFYYHLPFLAIPMFLLVLILHEYLNLEQKEFEAYNRQLKYTSLNTFLLSLILLIHSIYYSLNPWN